MSYIYDGVYMKQTRTYFMCIDRMPIDHRTADTDDMIDRGTPRSAEGLWGLPEQRD